MAALLPIRTWLALATVALWLGGSTGCTRMMWQRATLPTTGAADLDGVVVDSSGVPVSVVVCYDDPMIPFDAPPSYATIQLDSHGRPAPPFGAGWAEVAPVLEESTDAPTTRAAPERYALVAERRLRLARRPAIDEGCRVAAVEGCTTWVPAEAENIRLYQFDVSTTPSTLESASVPPGRKLLVRAPASRPTSTQAVVLIVPDRQPRPTGDRVASIAGATLLTPATVAFEVVFWPLWFVTGKQELP